MKSFDTRTYSVSDLAEWQSSGLLVLSPKFQRRAVWTSKAKSYLIDTVLRGKPMPKVLITQELVDGRNVRTVIDGQQRLRAILEYMGGSFTVMRTHNQEYAGSTYDELPDETKNDFLQYEIGVDVLFETELSELLDIFARLNTYSVKLNQTELLNATYLGSFKTTCHELGHRYAEFLLEARVLSNSQVARMGEVELTADLLGAIIGGVASRKQIPAFYKIYDDAEDSVEEASHRFRKVMSYIGEVYSPADLAGTNFRRVHLFYSLFLSVANLIVGAPDLPDVPSNGRELRAAKARVILDEISADFDDYTAPDHDLGSPPEDLRRFIEGSRRATTDLAVREQRSAYISKRLLGL